MKTTSDRNIKTAKGAAFEAKQRDARIAKYAVKEAKMNCRQMKIRVQELEDLIEAELVGQEADAGFDAGEFSGPIHDNAIQRLEDELADLKIELGIPPQEETPMKTKQEEINQLFGFMKKLEPQGYLSMLFTPALISWVESSIHSDFGPNIMAVIANWQEKANAAENHLRICRDTVATQRDTITELVQKEGQNIDALKEANTTLDELNLKYVNLVDSTNQRISNQAVEMLRLQTDLQERLHQLDDDQREIEEVNDLLKTEQTENENLRTKLAERDQEILTLKAQMFDIFMAQTKKKEVLDQARSELTNMVNRGANVRTLKEVKENLDGLK